MFQPARSLSASLALILWLAGGLAGGLAACTPVIETWREASGIAANDPDPATAPFTHNLADAEQADYPNLASVPPPPTRATTAAERARLAQSLIADRAATAAAAGDAPIGAAAGATPARRVAAAESPSLPYRAAATPAVRTATAAADVTPLSREHAAAAPPPVNPRDSTLQMPDVRALPEPESARAAPPPPSLPPAPRPAPSTPSPAAVASAAPQPPPPLPDLAPAPLPTAPARPAAARTVATLTGGGGTAEIARVAALYQQQPGHLLVVGYAAAPAAGGDPLAAYQAALDHAQAVAKALTAAGVPAAQIQTEAAVSGSSAGGRVEIRLAP